MESSQNKVPPISLLLVTHILIGPIVGIFVLINLVKTDFNDGPMTYMFWGYLIGVFPAILCAIVNVIILRALFKLDKNLNVFVFILAGVTSGFIVGALIYIRIDISQLDFILYSLVFCIPGALCGIFNRVLCKLST